MPRSARHCPGGIVYHVLNRSVAGIDLFKSEWDHQVFQKTLREAHTRLPVELFAYCVMSNHWHLVIRPHQDGDLSAFMQWLTLTQVQRWRTGHNTVGFGPLYKGRFKAFAIEEDQHLVTVLRYVERNPLRAGIVSHAQDWRWSSLYARLHGTADDKAILAQWPVDTPANWPEFVNQPQTATEEQALRQSIHRSRPFGSPTWQDLTAKRLNLSSSMRRGGRPRR